MGLPDRAAVVEFARREASPDHYREFEPITRGPAFAILMLIPLALLAGVCLAARQAAALLENKLKWR